MKRVMSAVLAAAVCVSVTCTLSGCDNNGGGTNGEVEYNIQATGNYSDGIMLPNLTTEQSELSRRSRRPTFGRTLTVRILS